MAGRVTLLILMTGLFAAAWSSDRPPGKTAEPVDPDQNYQSDSVRETTLHRWPITGYERVVDASHEWVPEIMTDMPIETRQRTAGYWIVLPSQHATALTAHILSRNWIDAGQLLYSASGKMRSLALWRQLTTSPSAQITSQPKSAGSSQR